MNMTLRRTPRAYNSVRYARFLVFVAGLGGLLYGIDIGIIAAALLYVSKTIDLSVRQTSLIVAAVLGGSMLSSLVAGILADRFGRKRMVIGSALLFVASVGVIVTSQGFAALMTGRLLQGASGGVIAVVIPLYLAECLGPKDRGRGTASFQLMLAVGIVIAAGIGWFYTHQAEAAILAANGNSALVRHAQDHAWRGMFLSVIYPGLAFFIGGLFLSETPRWLYGRGRSAEALESLRRSLSEQDARAEFEEMRDAANEGRSTRQSSSKDSLWQRKYILPFILACVILTCNQATGINSILGFLVVILKQAGMNAALATDGDLTAKLLMCVMTAVAMTQVERRGRKFLLKTGTAGVAVALLAASFLFLRAEDKRTDVTNAVRAATRGDAVRLPVTGAFGAIPHGQVTALTVLYSYGNGDKIASVLSSDPNPTLSLIPDSGSQHRLVVKSAMYGPVPTERAAWMIAAAICVFIAFYSVGPGVVVWLALSELMPTRIRSTGMGIALLLNQGTATLIASVFLSVVGRYGYSVMFFAWSVCSFVYFITAAFFLPETKGKSLEQIEKAFAHQGAGS